MTGCTHKTYNYLHKKKNLEKTDEEKFNEEQIRDKTDFVRTLSYNMQIMRKKLGFTQRYMAEQIGVSVNYISNVERGKTEITAYIVQKYCDLLGLTPNQIYNEDTNRIKISDSLNDNILKPVSYTHLTLPTTERV